MRLTVDDVTVHLDHRPVVHDVTLEVAPGALVGLVGPNGSGKSSLLRAVYRSLRPRRGVVNVGGDDVWRLGPREAARRTAAVLQERDTTAAGLSVAEVVTLGRTPHHGMMGRPGASDREAVADSLKRTGAEHLAERDITGLSGGERQRVLLARALAQHPHLLVLDEVTNHLDIRARFELLALIRGLGVTTLAVLHDLDLAVRFCEQLVVLDEGRVHAAGPVLDVLTPRVMADVFHVAARVERHTDGVVRINYAADPLTALPAPHPVPPPAPNTWPGSGSGSAERSAAR
ncbi:ABC transporter ATP-binding protein [Streptomyces spiramenti]|uniref:ABC transporter ATP-binding protein n=1 Tax=Streptomyces spiramenti TaxID=2720606 RepID=A0ABX1AI14_9ACTN|nr:ABC transporter ATP-binding protein [Streptomyces spiramenti]NJP64740.1 ABC transporter ATP-binding protein [Streptomyces spiramenti]